MAREQKKAIKLGFHEGARVRPGETFWAEPEFKAKWFVTKGSAEDKAATAVEEGNLLDKSIKEVLAVLKDQTDVELRALLSAEQSGKMRKGLIGAIDDELANRFSNPEGEQPEGDESKADPLA